MSNISFSSNFDTLIYKNNNPDLFNFTDEQLLNHYAVSGKNEGRICNKITNRHDLIQSIDKNTSCLEIGPFDCPVLIGPNIKYFDVLNKEELIERAIKCERNNNNVPYIDYVDNTGNLNIIDEKFDLILSCHSIEHQTNFIKHLTNVSGLLKNNGVYVVICPDKRYCFDHFIKETTIADIINMNYINNEKHTIKSVIEHRALTCHNDCVRHWNNDHGSPNIENIKNAINEYETTEGYIDVHSLQFTPESFQGIIDILKKNNFIDFYCERVYPTIRNSCEFYAVLRKETISTTILI